MKHNTNGGFLEWERRRGEMVVAQSKDFDIRDL